MLALWSLTFYVGLVLISSLLRQILRNRRMTLLSTKLNEVNQLIPNNILLKHTQTHTHTSYTYCRRIATR